MRPLPGKIFIRRLQLHARHGVMPQERSVGGEYSVSVCVTTDFARAADSDDVADTIDYSALQALVVAEMEKPSRLLEHVAARMASHILESFPSATEVEVEIVKVNPPMGGCCDGAGVSLSLSRE